MKLVRAPYRSGQPTDDFLPKLINKAKENMRAGEDDKLFLAVGITGTGKSNLLQHIATIYSPKPEAKNIVLRKEAFAQRQYEVNQRSVSGEKDLFLMLDEANVSRREAMSKWVKDIIGLYMTNRVFGILHLWAWPSAKLIDRTFIEERVAGIFFCFDKTNDRPRKYVFFKKESLLRMLDEGLELDTFTLKKMRKKYGTYQGMYVKYTGELTAAYKEIKLESALQISKDFKDKWAKNAPADGPVQLQAERPNEYQLRDLLGIFNVGVVTMRKIIMRARQDNPFLQNRYKHGMGWRFSEDDLTILKGYV